MAGADKGGKPGNQWQELPHTPPDRPAEPARSAPELDLGDEPLPLFDGPVRHVAETLKASGGVRGRPKGSANKRTVQMRDTLLKMGFRHPAMNLAALANAEPAALARELGCDADVAMGFIVKANVELLPYFESKRPTEIHVDKRELGVLVVGTMDQAAVAEGVFSLTGVIDEGEQDQ